MKNYLKKMLNSCIAGAFVLNVSSAPLLTDALENIIKKVSTISLSKVVDPIVLSVIATAYSSTFDQTDSTPFHTATGDEVFDGLVAANFLEFGTKIKIPELFGDKIFTVKDRMHRRFTNKYPHRIDVWFKNRGEAKKFGVQNIKIIVL